MKSHSRSVLGICAMFASLVSFVSTPSRADSGTEKILYNFTGGTDGNHPQGRLVFDKSGHLYGTNAPNGNGGGPCTPGGGCGTVFELTLSNGHWVENTIYSFCSLANCADGSNPQAGVVFDSAGNLYGTTMFGGDATCACGTVFELIPSNGSWTYHVLHTFTGTDGEMPEGGLTLDAAGHLYGTTIFGGPNLYGTVFRLAYASGVWTHTILHSFPASANDGIYPEGQLVVDKSGNVYGIGDNGGLYNYGTVFELKPVNGQWNETTLVNFSGPDGMYPQNGLIADKAGNLYGVTGESANYTYGTVFELIKGSGAWTENVLYTFTELSGDGAFPSAELLLDSAGNLFGVTEGGGVTGGNCYNSGCGTVFELTPSTSGWHEQMLYSFTGGLGGSDGYYPFAPLTTDNKGHLFGTTLLGGTGLCSQSGVISGCGIVFKVTPNEIFVPVSVAFPGTQLIGTTSKTVKVAFTYSGPGTLTLNSLAATLNFSVNTSGITANACNLSGSTSLGTGKTCYFNVALNPTGIGSLSGNVVASYTGDPSNSSLQLPLTGKGTAISVPPSVNFGTVTHGQQSSQPLTISNASTTTSIHVLSYNIGGTNASSFTVTNNPCSSIAPSALCQMTLRFAPATIGSYAASIQLKTDAGSNPTVKLSGTGN
jgi:uncharacterized repeat protein (TIGR03803 family)